MALFKKFDWSFKSAAKLLGFILLGFLALTVILFLIQFSYRSVQKTIHQYGLGESQFLSDSDEAGYAQKGTGFLGAVDSRIAPGIAPMPNGPDFSTGEKAEEYEVVTYDGQIKSQNLAETCGSIETLKEKAYVIFETSNRDDFTCYYRFKVEKDQAEAVLSVIKDLKPDNLNTNITSIKKSVEGVETEIEILTKKLNSIDETLTNAQAAYDEISELATQQQNADALAKIIDSKLNLIERLTNERLNIKSQIDYYNKNKADQLDQLEYTFFNVHVSKDVILDWKQLKENWKMEARQLVQDLNAALQAATLTLVTYLVYVVLGMVYVFISVFIFKFVWRGIRHIWRA